MRRRLIISPAQVNVLRLIAEHGKAMKHEPVSRAADWTWRINGTPKSGVVDTLIRKGILAVTEDKSSAVLSPRGKAILREAA